VTAMRERAPEGPGADGAAVDTGGDAEWAGWPGSVTFARFTERARRALTLARDASASLGQAEVGTEHLLLGILDEGANLGVRVLESLDVAPADIRAEVDGSIQAA